MTPEDAIAALRAENAALREQAQVLRARARELGTPAGSADSLPWRGRRKQNAVRNLLDR